MTRSFILHVDVLITLAGVKVQHAPVAVLTPICAANLSHSVLTGLDTPTAWAPRARVNHTNLGCGAGQVLTEICRVGQIH